MSSFANARHEYEKVQTFANEAVHLPGERPGALRGGQVCAERIRFAARRPYRRDHSFRFLRVNIRCPDYL